mmetsp:Transcript_10390/g.28705  ORF Transcript_10390/g.28705 Transcript_10390/m.28705 type:complete len:149 (+) Transcript_10390:154-600(+)
MKVFHSIPIAALFFALTMTSQVEATGKGGGKKKMTMMGLTGLYKGIDKDDGSNQMVEVYCTKKYCNFALTDSYWTTCSGNNGVGIIDGVTDISSIAMPLYCAGDDGGLIDVENPTATADFSLEVILGGILRRTSNGRLYYRIDMDMTM